MIPGPRSAVVIEKWGLLRLGIEAVLGETNYLVAGSSGRASEGMTVARGAEAELVIVGKAPDLKAQNALVAIKRLNPCPKVIFLIDRADGSAVAGLISKGADGLLLRSVEGTDLDDAIRRVEKGERVVAPALAADTVGRVGPLGEVTNHLSRKELEVLGELASGATYDEIAETLIVTKATVKTHLVHIYDKLEARNRQEAVAKGLALGLLG